MKIKQSVFDKLTEYGEIVSANIGLLKDEPELTKECLEAIRSDALRIFALACIYEEKLSPPSAR